MGSSSDFSKARAGSVWSPPRILLISERKLFANSVEVPGEEVVST